MAESRFISISNIKEAISIFPLFVDLVHKGIALQDVPSIDEEVERVLLWELYALSDDEPELVSGQITWGQVPAKAKKFIRD